MNESIAWFYNDCDSTSDSKWIPFGDVDNRIIEEAFSNGKTHVQLDQCSIDLRQCRRTHRQRTNSVRSDRFYTCEKLCQPLNEDETKNNYRFMNECRKQYRSIPTDQLLEKAAEGIITEGSALDKQKEAEWIGEQLRSVKGKSKPDIEKCVIFLYTFESFLYRLINRTLRENDHSKMNTLGAFCQILFQTDCSPTTEKVGYNDTLYRGAQLDQKTIKSYEQSIGQIKTWDAFTSTSKIRAKAECYGNVLFIINHDHSTRYKWSGMDISAISFYPSEDEVLIRAARNFRVDNVEKDPSKEKYIISLTLC